MYKNSDASFLLALQDMLSQNPRTTQREIAARLAISLGLVNQILVRVVKKGWVQIERVNARNMQYVITPAGGTEIMRLTDERKRQTFAEIHAYGENIAERLSRAKKDGFEKVVLYGKSDLDFLLAYECQKQAMPFEQRTADELSGLKETDAFVVTGETEQTMQAGAMSMMQLVG